MFRMIQCLIQAFLFVVSSCAVVDSNFKERVDWAAIGVTSRTSFTFKSVDARALAVTDAERQQCRAWFDENVRFADGTKTVPAYNFSVGGQSLRRHYKDWEFSVGEESAVGAVRRGGKTTYIKLTHKKSGIAATVEATIYEEYASCEWTVYLRNNSDDASPVVSAFYAADCTLPIGGSQQLYVSKGSGADANDFELRRSFVNPISMRFNANGGRTESTLPFFILCGSMGGAVMAVGWTGQWYTSIAQRFGRVAVRVKQETFRAALNASETVRSPLVSLTFYDGGNALKGFNMLRRWECDCVYTESATEITTAGLANEFSTDDADALIRSIREMPQETCDEANFLWMDAGWYKRNESWYDSVGNWMPDPDRFPQGLAPIAEAGARRGMGLLLWYEPERCCKDTQVYNEAMRHEGWLLTRSDQVNMVNLANDDACEYLGDLIANSIRDNKVGLYRQDFNFTPLPFWEKADKELYGGRKGVAENHYVTNLYRYLDRLLEVNPGLIIDNCASGGKRLD
ncbi:MAG: alpha-galactosidase, partial [Clostridia bacterium]|nr:alpha-galactosidase [Clostridia bacterium]